MLNDVFAVTWKEWKEMFASRSGKRNSSVYRVLIAIALIGVFMPIQVKSDWITEPLSLLSWSWLPVFWTVGMITNAIAGERERHTLETLLASRLSDQSILIGKILAAVGYGWGVMFVSSLLGVIVVNLLYIEGAFQFYAPLQYFGILLASFLLATLFSTIGVLVSLHASSAREAYSKLSLAMFVLYIVPFLGLQFLPESAIISIVQWSERLTINWNVAIPVIFGVLVVLDVVLLMITNWRFQRNKLILD